MRIRAFLLFLFFLSFGGVCRAELHGLVVSLNLSDSPKQAQAITLNSDGSFSVYELVSGKISEADSNGHSFYSISVEGAPKKVWLSYVSAQGSKNLVSLEADRNYVVLPLDLDWLRKSILDKRNLFKKLEAEQQDLLFRLARAKSDLDIIANVDKIAEVREVNSQLTQELSMLDTDLEARTEALKSMSHEQLMTNYETIQRELTTQLEEIVGATKLTESEEFLRKTKSEEEVQYINEVVEETRFDSVHDLEIQLQALQNTRFELQNQLGFSDEELREYQLW